MVANCTIYNLDTNPVMLTRSITIWSLSEYFFGACVADTDSNDPPRWKIVSAWRTGLHKFGLQYCITKILSDTLKSTKAFDNLI